MSYPSVPQTPPGNAVQQKYLSVASTYYIRKLLRQNIDRLEFILAAGAELQADALSDLNSVLDSLYLESDEIAAAVQQLEHLVLRHQALTNQSLQHRQELRQAEQKIFWLLGFKLRKQEKQGTILLVDDNPYNLRLLSTALTQQGYEVCSAINGSLALNTVRDIKPDLILLDVMMPGMDGYEVCKRLKADPATRDIPVIFISANNATLDKVKAFEVGGMDYIPKPFQIEEVLARVVYQLTLRTLQKRLEEQNIHLQQEVLERRQLERRYQGLLERSSLRLLLRELFRQSGDRGRKGNLSRSRAIALLRPESQMRL